MDSNSTKLSIVHDQNVFPCFQVFSCWISMQCSSLVQYQHPTNLLQSRERLLHQPEFGFQLPCPSYQRVPSEARSLLNTVICHISLIWQQKIAHSHIISPAVSLCFSLELNIRVRVKSESTFILSKSLGKFQPGRGKPVVYYVHQQQ